MADITIDNREKKNKNENFLSQRKHLFLFLAGWLGFIMIASVLQFIALTILGDMNAVLRDDVSIAINCTAYGSLLIILFSIFGFTNLKKLTEKFVFLKTYIAAFICLGSVIVFEIVYTHFIEMIGAPIADNANQSELESLMRAYPALCIIFFAIIGPICEELTYRVGLFSFCQRKSKIFAYIITPIVFAFIHFNIPTADLGSSEFTSGLINELLNLPVYCFAGFAFCFTYDHYGFESSVTAHILNNILSFVLVFAK